VKANGSILPAKRNVDCLGFDRHDEVAMKKKSRSPIETIFFWHSAIKKELNRFTEEARKLQSTMGASFSGFCDFFDILVQACVFRR
jgi:hypothetical protein